MGKKSSSNVNKHKEKRQARKLEQRRVADAMAHVSSANKLNDYNSMCQDLLSYQSSDLDVTMYIKSVNDLEKSVIDWAIDLTERNMKKLYETCAWGWNSNRKKAEMTDDTALYLIARDKNAFIAFSHFRFDMDYEEPVLYCYELQVEANMRRKGLGQQLLTVLEYLARATHMSCVRLTALTHNPAACSFFRACGYELDPTTPDKEEAAHYEILSKATNFPELETNTEKCPLTEGLNRVHVDNE